jgi:hypothetical protein
MTNIVNNKSTLYRLIIIALAVLLLGACVWLFFAKKEASNERNIAAKERYIKLYQAQELGALKKKNKELYDSIMAFSDKKPESALEIKYKYKYKTDTIYKTQFIVKNQTPQTQTYTEFVHDTTYITNPQQSSDYNIYSYTNDNDTIQTNIEVKAKDLEWVTVDATIHDKFIIINRVGDNNVIETEIDHSENVEIEGVAAWHKKTSWKDRLYIGPSINVGFDPINKRVVPTIGFSIGYNLWKH